MEVAEAAPVMRGASDLPPECVRHPAGIWLPTEPATEEVILSDRYDLELLLLHLEDRVTGSEPPDEEVPDLLDLLERRTGR